MQYTYELHGFSDDEAAFIDAVLNDSVRGWAALGYTFQRTQHVGRGGRGRPAARHFRVTLCTPAAMASMFPQPHLRGLSVTDKRGPLAAVYIHGGNWYAPPRSYMQAFAAADAVWEYRAYVIAHEVGHVLGAEHARCPSPGAPAPVMMQQTRGCGGCVPDPWVVKH